MEFVEKVINNTIKTTKDQNLGGWSIEKNLYNWMVKHIPENSTILELGSGYGTIELSKKYNMISIEHDKKWVGLCEDAKYIYAPIKDGWYDVNILKTELKGLEYTAVLVDGPPEKVSERIKLLKNLSLFNSETIFIFDDIQRNGEMELCKSVSKILDRKFRVGMGVQKNFGVII